MNDMQIHLTQMPVSVYLPASPSPSSHWVVQWVVVQIGGAPIHRTTHPAILKPFYAALAGLLSN